MKLSDYPGWTYAREHGIHFMWRPYFMRAPEGHAGWVVFWGYWALGTHEDLHWE